MLRSILVFATIFLFAPVSYASDTHSDNSPYQGWAVVSNVVDGDTFWLRPDSAEQIALISEWTRGKNIRGGKFKVRLKGIDTPESVHPDRSRNTDFGREVSRIVKSELTGERVYYVCFEVGYYGRPICSVLLDENTIYDVTLIERGYSKYETRYGKHPLWDAVYKDAEDRARAAKAGIWKE